MEGVVKDTNIKVMIINYYGLYVDIVVFLRRPKKDWDF